METASGSPRVPPPEPPVPRLLSSGAPRRTRGRTPESREHRPV